MFLRFKRAFGLHRRSKKLLTITIPELQSLPSPPVNTEEARPSELQVPSRNVTRRSVEAGPGDAKQCPDLPLELHELIIDNLAGDVKALKQCALTCRVYRTLAQQLLFGILEVNIPRGPNPVHGLLGILEDSPWISSYTALLHIKCSGYIDPASDKDRTAILRLITALPNMGGLVMSATGTLMTSYLQFSIWDPPCQLEIMSVCANLRFLALAWIQDVPLAMFDHMHQLERLHLLLVDFLQDRKVMDARSWEVPSSIKEMVIEDVHIAKTTIFPFLKARGFSEGLLDYLKIAVNRARQDRVPREVYEGMQWLIRGSADLLKDLDITIGIYDPFVTARNGDLLFDVSRMPLLERLSLTCATYIPETDAAVCPMGLGWALRHLETIPPGRRFKSITLQSVIVGPGVWVIRENDPDFQGLRRLEYFILNDILPSTEEFSIRFICGPNALHEVNLRLLRQEMEKCLPALKALRLLNFNED